MKKLSILFLLVITAMSTIGCSRTSSQVWDDSKTAGRYAGKSVRSLWGANSDSRQVNSSDEFFGKGKEEFAPLEGEGSLSNAGGGQATGLTANGEAIPQSDENPGDPGSRIPGIDSFTPAASSALAGLFLPIYFPYNSNLVKGQENVTVIKNIAKHMKENPNLYVFVAGHCDDRGSASYNLALGARRSNAVRRLLVQEGVNLQQLFTISYGKERPAILGSDESAWSKNRRAEFHIYTR